MNVFTANSSKPLVLGRQGENLAVTLQFPIKKWIEAFGTGSFALVHQRATDAAPYPAVITSDAENVYWRVSSSDVAVKGYGRAELRYTVDSVVVKSEIFTTLTAEALGQTTTPPDPWQAWVDEVLDARDEVLDRVPDYTGKNGKYLHVKSDGSATEWADVEGGSSDFDLLSNRPSYNGTTMTHATAIPEVKTATWDAKYAKPSGGIPKTDLASDVQTSLGKADTALQEHQSLSAYRTSAEQDVIDATKGTYSKPDGGIPSTDMTSAVQTSLGKADTALQEHQSLSAYRTSSAQDVIDATKEVASNKVTSIDAQSTDAQYPSAKLLYDKLSEQSSVIANKADEADLEETNRSLQFLWELNKGQTWDFDVDSETIYQKTIPSGSKTVTADKIGGRTVVQNNKIANGNFVDTSGWAANVGTISVSNNVCTYTIASKNASAALIRTISVVANHKYFVSCKTNLSESSTRFRFNICGNFGSGSISVSADTDTEVADIITATTIAYNQFYIYFDNNVGLSAGTTATIQKVRIVDLTQWFGRGNEPSTTTDAKMDEVYAYLEAHPEYNTGTLLSADTNSVELRVDDNVLTDTFIVPQSLRTAYPLRSAWSVYDEYDFERMKFVKKILVYVFDGTENWIWGSGKPYINGGLPDVITTGISTSIQHSFCDKFIFSPTYNDSTVGVYFNETTAGNYTPRFVPESSITSLAEWKTWLASNPVTFYVPAITPVEYDISSYFPNDFILAETCEAGGSMTYKQTASQLQIPVKNTFMVKLNEVS